MSVIGTFTVNFVIIILWIMQIAMMVRAVLWWVPGGDELRLADFLYSVTEPLIIPMRRLFNRRGWFRMSPIDIPFFVTYLLIMVLTVMLESLK